MSAKNQRTNTEQHEWEDINRFNYTVNYHCFMSTVLQAKYQFFVCLFFSCKHVVIEIFHTTFRII
jgi:hypothetical protein